MFEADCLVTNLHSNRLLEAEAVVRGARRVMHPQTTEPLCGLTQRSRSAGRGIGLARFRVPMLLRKRSPPSGGPVVGAVGVLGTCPPFHSGPCSKRRDASGVARDLPGAPVPAARSAGMSQGP